MKEDGGLKRLPRSGMVKRIRSKATERENERLGF